MGKGLIHIDSLSFGYKPNELVLDKLCLDVPEGSIYGFLGANGAGKTTTLKLILSLLNNKHGNIFYDGDKISSSYPGYLSQIGSLIENPSFYGHLSARQNLKIWAKYFNAGHNRINELLELMKLSNAANKRTENFSTGMKQRLGIASALLHDPQLLILDEPTNGLDPMGVQELRLTLQRLRDNGKTIIISSHILSEVEKMVTHLGIIKEGSLAFEGTIDSLYKKKSNKVEILIQVNDVDRAIKSLTISTVKQMPNNNLLIGLNDKEDIPKVIKSLSDAGVSIYEIKQVAMDLESIFLSLSNDDQT